MILYIHTHTVLIMEIVRAYLILCWRSYVWIQIMYLMNLCDVSKYLNHLLICSFCG